MVRSRLAVEEGQLASCCKRWINFRLKRTACWTLWLALYVHKYEKYWTSKPKLWGDQGGWVKVEAWQRRQPQFKSFGDYWTLLRISKEMWGNLRKIKNQTTKKGETREKAIKSANEERGKQSFERKEKTGLASSFIGAQCGHKQRNKRAEQNEVCSEKIFETRSARKRFLTV